MASSLRFIVLATIACAFVAPAGAATHAVKGNGVVEEQTRGTGHYDKVVLDMPNDVELELGKAETVTVITDENLQDLIETKVRDGALHIALAKPDTCLLASTLKIRMQARQLGALTVSGGGSFNVGGKLHIAGDKAAPHHCGAG
jgi:hypothetical protein